MTTETIESELTETIESEFVEVLSTITNGLGIAAERIFGIFVNAQVMLGIIDIVSVLLILLGTVFAGWYTRRLCIKAWRGKDGEWKDSDDQVAAIWVPATVGIISLFVIWEATSILGGAAMMILCPEYSAMIEIIDRVTP